jgi:hypothetical protein
MNAGSQQNQTGRAAADMQRKHSNHRFKLAHLKHLLGLLRLDFNARPSACVWYYVAEVLRSAIHARTTSTFQADAFGPSWIGFGTTPSAIHWRSVLSLIDNTRATCAARMNPSGGMVYGSWFFRLVIGLSGK